MDDALHRFQDLHDNPSKRTGNLYYALTHSPEPMSEEYSYALTWEAATERFEKAGCITLAEAQLYERWVESGNAGVEVRQREVRTTSWFLLSNITL